MNTPGLKYSCVTTALCTKLLYHWEEGLCILYCTCTYVFYLQKLGWREDGSGGRSRILEGGRHMHAATVQNYLIAVCCVAHSTLTRSLYHLLFFLDGDSIWLSSSGGSRGVSTVSPFELPKRLTVSLQLEAVKTAAATFIASMHVHQKGAWLLLCTCA